MNIQDFKFPIINEADRIFSTTKTDASLLKEAQARGYYNLNSRDPYLKLAADLFYKGGKLNFKKGLPEEFIRDCSLYLKAFMASWEPKHEEKMAISALLLSELVTI